MFEAKVLQCLDLPWEAVPHTSGSQNGSDLVWLLDQTTGQDMARALLWKGAGWAQRGWIALGRDNPLKKQEEFDPGPGMSNIHLFLEGEAFLIWNTFKSTGFYRWGDHHNLQAHFLNQAIKIIRPSAFWLCVNLDPEFTRCLLLTQ